MMVIEEVVPGTKVRLTKKAITDPNNEPWMGQWLNSEAGFTGDKIIPFYRKNGYMIISQERITGNRPYACITAPGCAPDYWTVDLEMLELFEVKQEKIETDL